MENKYKEKEFEEILIENKGKNNIFNKYCKKFYIPVFCQDLLNLIIPAGLIIGTILVICFLV